MEMNMRRGVLAGALGVALLLGACAGGNEEPEPVRAAPAAPRARTDYERCLDDLTAEYRRGNKGNPTALERRTYCGMPGSAPNVPAGLR